MEGARIGGELRQMSCSVPMLAALVLLQPTASGAFSPKTDFLQNLDGQYILMDAQKKSLIKCGLAKKLNSGGQEHVHHHSAKQVGLLESTAKQQTKEQIKSQCKTIFDFYRYSSTIGGSVGCSKSIF